MSYRSQPGQTCALVLGQHQDPNLLVCGIAAFRRPCSCVLVSQNAAWRTGACICVLVLVLAGALDISRAISGTNSYMEFDRDQINLAAEIRQKTPARALVLYAPTFNSPVFLTGRRSLLGYPGWAWSRGLDYTEREDQIRRIYRGDPEAAKLMRREHVDYVMIGPLERESMSANEVFFSHYAKIAEHGAYRLYKVSSD